MPPKSGLSEEERHQRRKAQNREAAWRCRRKRKVLITKLEKECEAWRKNYQVLMETYSKLVQEEIPRLQSELAFARAQIAILPPPF